MNKVGFIYLPGKGFFVICKKNIRVVSSECWRIQNTSHLLPCIHLNSHARKHTSRWWRVISSNNYNRALAWGISGDNDPARGIMSHTMLRALFLTAFLWGVSRVSRVSRSAHSRLQLPSFVPIFYKSGTIIFPLPNSRQLASRSFQTPLSCPHRYL